MIIQLAIIIRIKKNMITFITTEIIKLTIQGQLKIWRQANDKIEILFGLAMF